MKCIRCGRDSRKKDRTAHDGYCYNCGQLFVTNPETDGLTDRALKSAEDAVCGNGAYFFLPHHLGYELTRRLRKKARRRLVISAVIVAVLMLVVFLLGWDFWVVTAIGGMIVIGVYAWTSSAQTRTPQGFAGLIERWHRVNPNPKCLRGVTLDKQTPASPPDLGEVSFDRVLICDRDEYADFLLANLFHFHYSCPVFSAAGYPRTAYRRLIERLRANPKLTVFLVHDLTPAGIAFAYDIRSNRDWFADHPGVKYVDMGLLPSQIRLVSRILIPLEDIVGAGRNYPRYAKMRAGKGVELTVLQPQRLFPLCGACLAEGKAFNDLSSGWDGIDLIFEIGYG